MAKGHEETFELNGVQIKTIVTSNENEIDKHLSSFFRPPNNHQTQVIGFDVEWSLVYNSEEALCAKSKCATLQLCDGHTCLIIQLNHLPNFKGIFYPQYVYKSLLNFLRQPNVTFVGFGIKDTLPKLEKQFGFGIRNVVELGPLAATALKMPRLSYCGVDELAFEVNRFDLREYRPLTGHCDWDYEPLSKELAKLATINVYSYFKIGGTLLQSNVVVGGISMAFDHRW
ncbi:hypothetical protein TSUD_38700 [Trifolium subterraneum]|uniref:3'-5' exonuclease domain-containing protein n=1 Tax=Trifolium subterraneum TaxID=3900 RepID=A0A2Z6N2T8_TRISU|nr:hypothetical protein TSUD_38700 [Trifolium subterraneum]